MLPNPALERSARQRWLPGALVAPLLGARSTRSLYDMNRVGDSLYCTGANEEIVRAFVQNNVEFVLIGGLAVSWHCRDRTADDMDLLVNPTPENSERIFRALTSLRLAGFERHSFAKPGLQARLKQPHYAELLTPRGSDATYSDVAADASEAKLFNIPIRVASVARLIHMKEVAAEAADAQRAKHLKDIELLKRNVV